MLPNWNLSTGKWLQNEWPWMTLNGYFMTKWVFDQHFLNQSVWMSEIVQPLRFCCVLCIARSDQLASLRRHAQRTRCFSAVAELLVWTTHTLDFGDPPVGARGIAINQTSWCFCIIKMHLWCKKIRINDNFCLKFVRTQCHNNIVFHTLLHELPVGLYLSI